ncbi:MAG TPA: hypothetical protein VIX18_02465, partial [Nitrospirota bacterium]
MGNFLNKMTSRTTAGLIGAGFTCLMLALFVHGARQNHERSVEKALTEARTIFELNHAYRSWVAGH